MRIGATCAVPECGRYVRGHGTEIAQPMREHEATHQIEDYPLNDDGSVIWNCDPLVLSETHD